jgi:hypothetical protein
MAAEKGVGALLRERQPDSQNTRRAAGDRRSPPCRPIPDEAFS